VSDVRGRRIRIQEGNEERMRGNDEATTAGHKDKKETLSSPVGIYLYRSEVVHL
jgi:hypothetical protein